MVATPSIAPTPPRTRRRLIWVLGAGVLVAVLVALLIVMSSILVEPSRTTVVIENPTDYAVRVQVRAVEGGAALDLGEVRPTSRREIRDVADQGDRWRFEFSYAGVDAGALEVAGEEVNDGVVMVPSSVAQVLSDAGVAPPPG